VLKEKSHLLSGIAKLIKRQAGNVRAVNADRPASGFRGNDDSQQDALSRAAAPQHG